MLCVMSWCSTFCLHALTTTSVYPHMQISMATDIQSILTCVQPFCLHALTTTSVNPHMQISMATDIQSILTAVIANNECQEWTLAI